MDRRTALKAIGTAAVLAPSALPASQTIHGVEFEIKDFDGMPSIFVYGNDHPTKKLLAVLEKLRLDPSLPRNIVLTNNKLSLPQSLVHIKR
jgi:hypothetical protein